MSKKNVNKTNLIVALFALVIVLICAAFVGNQMYIKQQYPMEYSEYIVESSQKHGVDPVLVASVIRVESKYQRKAKSKTGAMGLMQIMPDTGQWLSKKMKIDFKEENLYDPKTNIDIGCYYLSYLIEKYDGEIDVALAAYNAGPTNVSNWLKDEKYSSDKKTLNDIPFEETENYVKKVNGFYKPYEKYHGKDLKK